MKKRQYLSPNCCKVLIINSSPILVGSPTGENYQDSGDYGGFNLPFPDNMFDGLI